MFENPVTEPKRSQKPPPAFVYNIQAETIAREIAAFVKPFST
jgi:hypothetical protein